MLHIEPVIYEKPYNVCLLVNFSESSVGRERRNVRMCMCIKRVMPLVTGLNTLLHSLCFKQSACEIF